ncbi:hypothetical protein AMECASPLE_037493 [Ameca splendens]|uniref:Uncharacterized protein n=1 Tax=Ameca splendens TaxID=208324 RepID=A0ABV0Y835_9TELE
MAAWHSGDMTWAKLPLCSADLAWAELQQHRSGDLAWAELLLCSADVAWAELQHRSGYLAWAALQPPHSPSAPAVVERAEPRDRTADVSSPPPSAAEPSDPWCSPAVREVHVWQKHSVKTCVMEDPGMQMSRQHDSK